MNLRLISLCVLLGATLFMGLFFRAKVESHFESYYDGGPKKPVHTPTLSFFNGDLLRPLPADRMRNAVEFDNRLAFLMIAADPSNEGNRLISPVSLAEVLCVLGSAADASTSDTMAAKLGFSSNWSDLAGSFAQWKDWTEKLPGLKLESVTSFWHADDISINPDFARRFSSSALEIKALSGDPELALREINQWASDHTHGKIHRVFDTLKEDTTAVLANALYYKGKWVAPFSEQNTHDDYFENAHQQAEPCKMMERSSDFQYIEVDGVQWLQMQYEPFGCFNMVLALPKKGQSALALATGLNHIKYAGIREQLDSASYREGTVELPRFKIERRLDLINTLSEFGLWEIMDGGNLSALSDQLQITDFQQAKQIASIEVDEAGSEAAAVTGVAMAAGIAGTPEEQIPFKFRADHPFAFFIEDTNHIIIFAGILNSLSSSD